MRRSVVDLKIEARDALGNDQARRKLILDHDIEGPIGPVPVFSTTRTNFTMSPAWSPRTSLAMGVEARFAELIVPVNAGPASPGRVNATGPTVLGTKRALGGLTSACGARTDTAPFVKISNGSESTT